jgi:hypothetical protein
MPWDCDRLMQTSTVCRLPVRATAWGALQPQENFDSLRAGAQHKSARKYEMSLGNPRTLLLALQMHVGGFATLGAMAGERVRIAQRCREIGVPLSVTHLLIRRLKRRDARS